MVTNLRLIQVDWKTDVTGWQTCQPVTMGSLIYSLDALVQSVVAEPDRWRPLVLTNGCFDLLHAGHVRYLTAAKQLGKVLVVGLNSDRSVRAIKPASRYQLPRPIQPEAQRAEVLAALKPVDAVVLFDEPTAQRLIERLKPDIYVKGGDYQLETLPETPFVYANGGQVRLISIEVPTSTSEIIKQILNR